MVQLLGGDDGLLVAVRIVRDVAEEAHAQVIAQINEINRQRRREYVLDRRGYRSLWQAAGPELGYPLFALRCAFHPYIHLGAALGVITDDARRCLQVTDPVPLLAHMLRMLDMTIAAWEFGHVLVDADAADLVGRLISATTQIRLALSEPPLLPPPIRELMRRNNTTKIYDGAGRTVIGGINVPAEMRQSFLL